MPSTNVATVAEPNYRPFIRRAVEIAGSQAKLAEGMGCSQQFISWLLHRAENISGEIAVACEIATAGAITRHDLRPDLFGPKPDGGRG